MILEKNEIPQGVIQELDKHCPDIDWRLYGAHVPDLKDEDRLNVTTRRLEYKKKDGDLKPGVVLDPVTFEKQEVMGYSAMTYLALGIWDSTSVKLVQILEAGQVMVPE